jgi:hypothetical protein
MTREEALQIGSGDYVFCSGVLCRVNSVRSAGIAAPHFRLSPVDGVEREACRGLTSYRLCRIATQDEMQQALAKA